MLSVSTKFLSHPIYKEKHSLLKHLTTVAKNSDEIFNKTDFPSKKIAYYSGLLHDIGKLNPFYQKLFHETNEFSDIESELTKQYERVHSAFSAWAADKLLFNTPELDDKSIYKIMILIHGHHTQLRNILNVKKTPQFINSHNGMSKNLKTFFEQKDLPDAFTKLNQKKCLDRFPNPVDFQMKVPKISEETALDNFAEMLMAFSSLIQGDWCSFDDHKIEKFDLTIDTSPLIKDSSNNKLNELRTKFQNQAMSNINGEDPIIIIRAPTGIGKTKLFLNLIEKYNSDKSLARVFYFSPLLALTEDFEDKVRKIFPKDTDNTSLDQILIYNHIFAGSLTDRSESENNNRDLSMWSFLNESFQQKFIITTTQRLLMTMYSNKPHNIVKFASFTNSLLIIDEVQTIPKFILSNFKNFLCKLNQYMHTKIILVSATIPDELKSIKEINIDKKVIQNYQSMTKKFIRVQEKLDINKIETNKTLVMSNTRKKTANLFDEIKKIHTSDIIYLSSGIRKKDRIKILKDLKDKEKYILVSTQVVEAGVDISFTNIYREIAPLDNIVQVMGRLNREAEKSGAELIIFKTDNSHIPYSELEFIESKSRLENISNSIQLYDSLSDYYKTIHDDNLLNANLDKAVGMYMKKMDFEGLWEFVSKKLFLQDGRDNVFIPDSKDTWDEIKRDLMSSKSKNNYKKYGLLVASLPRSPYGIQEYFDPELFEKHILLPKKEYLEEFYDKNLGLDKWLINK